MDYSIIIPSNNKSLALEAQQSLGEESSIIFDGTNYPSYSKLINDCILSANTEIIIIVNHKLRANSRHIEKMLSLINKGFGLSCMMNFHFYGFKKDLIRKIGFFDERYTDGMFEDTDMIRRLIEHNIGWYTSEETPELKLSSTWAGKLSRDFFYKKWKDGKPNQRLLPDEQYDYDLGPYQGATFLPLCETITTGSEINYFNSINFKFK